MIRLVGGWFARLADVLRIVRRDARWVHPANVTTTAVDISLELDPAGLLIPGALGIERAFLPAQPAFEAPQAAPELPDSTGQAPQHSPVEAPAASEPSMPEGEPARKPSRAA